MTFKKGDKVFVEFEVLDTCHNSEYLLVKDKSNQTRQFLKSEAQVLPKKPVVPKVAIDFYEKYKDDSLSFGEWFGDFYSKEFLEDLPKGLELAEWLYDNEDSVNLEREFVLATLIVKGINAVEVEQEQLYTVEVPNPNNTSKNTLALRKLFTGIEICRVNAKTYKTDKHCQLTEAEIKKDFVWAWQWAKPVEEIY